MSIRLGENNYGKRAINLSKIIRHNDRHEIRQLSVSVALQGDFQTVHTLGDNSKVLPTDTMKNTVYVLAKDLLMGSIEDFGLALASHFKTNNPQLSSVKIEISEYNWQRMVVNGEAHPNAFINGGSEKHHACIDQAGSSVVVSSGIEHLMILKTTDSAFKGYIKDQYTSLKETNDRILATECSVSWTYTKQPVNYSSIYAAVRDSLLSTFAGHKSLSVQHTLYAMGEAVLQNVPEVADISLTMPNKHHILYNLEQFGLNNNNEIFIATDEPFGFITGTVTRGE